MGVLMAELACGKTLLQVCAAGADKGSCRDKYLGGGS